MLKHSRQKLWSQAYLHGSIYHWNWCNLLLSNMFRIRVNNAYTEQEWKLLFFFCCATKEFKGLKTQPTWCHWKISGDSPEFLSKVHTYFSAYRSSKEVMEWGSVRCAKYIFTDVNGTWNTRTLLYQKVCLPSTICQLFIIIMTRGHCTCVYY